LIKGRSISLNRTDFQKLALVRLKDAEVLLSNNQYSGAYYLSGYVIECALKACIAKNTRKFDFPPDKKALENIYTHSLDKLVIAAKLKPELDTRITDVDFSPLWLLVKKWSEESRYKTYTKREAKDIYSAVTDPNHGVLQWLQQHW
jgi:HEPN domain-containing protein